MVSQASSPIGSCAAHVWFPVQHVSVKATIGYCFAVARLIATPTGPLHIEDLAG